MLNCKIILIKQKFMRLILICGYAACCISIKLNILWMKLSKLEIRSLFEDEEKRYENRGGMRCAAVHENENR